MGPTTGLDADEVLYFGNAIGETGNDPANASVNILDIGLVRGNQTGRGSAGIDNVYDVNRDDKVNILDIGLVRNNQSGRNPLRLISVPGGMPLAADGLKDTTTSPDAMTLQMLRAFEAFEAINATRDQLEMIDAAYDARDTDDSRDDLTLTPISLDARQYITAF